ncbi:hypothetical protein RRG08_058502 [Elysia crispata]|uniref:Uncharacterized protein n=1 Tax=Elysia crispata TaxID=231223 RepID=A0AAE0ZWT0_9GAST|nr:hypothetical protein RRG08_058502 [Elysia crispata]
MSCFVTRGMLTPQVRGHANTAGAYLATRHHRDVFFDPGPISPGTGATDRLARVRDNGRGDGHPTRCLQTWSNLWPVARPFRNSR